MAPMPLLAGLVRWRYVVLAALGGIMFSGGLGHLTGDNDWGFFTWGSDLLFGEHRLFVRRTYSVNPTLPGGLHLYGNYPFLQIGPPPLLIAKVLGWGPRQGIYLAGALIQLLCLLFLYAADRAFNRDIPLQVLIGGAMVTGVWGSLTHYRHLDDAIALTCASVAALCLTRDRAALAGMAVGLGATSKPWAVPLLALTLAPPTGRARLRAATSAVLTVLVFWAPFIIVDQETLRLGDVTLQFSKMSALAALGISHVGAGEFVRLLQFGSGLLLATLVVLRGHWALAPLAAFGARLAVEPSAYPYYAIGVVAAAFLADLGALRARVPLLTLISTAGWMAAQATAGSASAWARLITYGGLCLAAVLLSFTLPRHHMSPGE